MATGSSARTVGERYRLDEPVGRGGMGQVWRAEDTLLHRQVAVKEVRLPAGLDDSERDRLRTRVMREARTAARLNHPGSITVYDVVESDDTVFIVMELVETGSLADLVANEGPLAPDRAARLGIALLDTLVVAHDGGIVHRDVKPSNVMVLPDGGVKLADFGVALVKDDPSITSTGMVLGSPAYMAPEQAAGAPAGPASDYWGLGATLYFAVEGQPPFGKGEPLPTMHAVVHEQPRPMHHDGALAGLVAALLAKAPEERPSPAEARRRLEQVVGAGADQVTARDALARTQPLTATAVAAPTPSEATPRTQQVTVPPAVPERRRSPLGLLAIPVVILLLLLAVAAWPDGGDDGEVATEEQPPAEAPADEGAAQAPAAGEGRAQAGGGEDTAAGEGLTLTEYRDPATGYRVSYPRSWEVQRSGSRTDFRDPRTGAYLRVDWTDDPGPSPEAAWKEQSKAFADRYPDYEEIGIEKTEFKGHKAALWEYTYTGGGAALHATNLGFVTDSHGFALNFQSAAEGWDGYQDLFGRMRDSFVVPEPAPRGQGNDDDDD